MGRVSRLILEQLMPVADPMQPELFPELPPTLRIRPLPPPPMLALSEPTRLPWWAALSPTQLAVLINSWTPEQLPLLT
jgi:hypothetical protein